MKSLNQIDDRTRERIARAGLTGRLGPGGVAFMRALGFVCAGVVGSGVLSIVGFGRLGLILMAAFLLVGLSAPDLLLARTARIRQSAVARSLPDAIEILSATNEGSGGIRGTVNSISSIGSGPLAREFGVVVAEMDAGAAPAESLEHMRDRLPVPEIASLSRALERSAELGAPLADELARQAARAREVERRARAERAARSAPKIQLVIALVMVPSAMLLIAAGVSANLGDLITGL